MKEFETERLLLKPVTLNEASFILELMNTPKWLKFIGDRKVLTLSDAVNYISKKMLPQMEEYGYGNYIIARKADGTLIGTCGLYRREGLNGVDIGFALLPDYEQQGFGFEAANRLKEAAFTDFNLSKLNGITLAENEASRYLLEKLGLQCMGTIKLADDPDELLLYTLMKTESGTGSL